MSVATTATLSPTVSAAAYPPTTIGCTVRSCTACRSVPRSTRLTQTRPLPWVLLLRGMVALSSLVRPQDRIDHRL